jgi:hypothetical protein
MSKRFASILFFGAFLLSGSAAACTSTRMMATEGGFGLRVFGGSDKVAAVNEPGERDQAFTLDLLSPYFVICQDGQFYKVTDRLAETVEQAERGKIGYVLKSQVHSWPTREALSFSDLAFTGDRPEIVAWDDHDILQKFLDSGNVKLGPPAYKEDLQSTLKRERATRPYPVLSSRIEKLRGTVAKRVFEVLLPVAMPPDAKVVIDSQIPHGNEASARIVPPFFKLDKAMTSATFVIAFNAVEGMAPFAAQLAGDLKTAFESLPPDIRMASRIGFVFFRNETDDERYVIIRPQSVADAVNALANAAKPEYMRGGGDHRAPVLDAVYIAHHLFPWDKGSDQGGGGRRILIAVLGDDAKPTTLGTIHNGVPPAIGPAKIANDLLSDGIPLISVQANPNAGPNLVPVLSAIGEGSGGSFIEWGEGGDDRRGRVAAALARQLVSSAEKTYLDGKRDLEKLKFDYRGYPTIPLAVLDGEKLDLLRAAATKYNIDPQKGGVLVRRAFLLENDDLLVPQVKVDRKTLERLIVLILALGLPDASQGKSLLSWALAEIAGKDYDPKEDIASLVLMRLGIQFRTSLLDLSPESLEKLDAGQRQTFATRIEPVGKSLARFLDAHPEEFDRLPGVWMPISQLP